MVITYTIQGNVTFCTILFDWLLANLTRNTSPTNSTPRRFPFYLLLTLLLYFIFIFHLPRCTLLDFFSVSYPAFLPVVKASSFLTCSHQTARVKGHLNFKMVPVLPYLDPSLIFPMHLLPSPVHRTRFSFCFFPGFLNIFILLSSKNKNA